MYTVKFHFAKGSCPYRRRLQSAAKIVNAREGAASYVIFALVGYAITLPSPEVQQLIDGGDRNSRNPGYRMPRKYIYREGPFSSFFYGCASAFWTTCYANKTFSFFDALDCPLVPP